MRTSIPSHHIYFFISISIYTLCLPACDHWRTSQAYPKAYCHTRALGPLPFCVLSESLWSCFSLPHHLFPPSSLDCSHKQINMLFLYLKHLFLYSISPQAQRACARIPALGLCLQRPHSSPSPATHLPVGWGICWDKKCLPRADGLCIVDHTLGPSQPRVLCPHGP